MWIDTHSVYNIRLSNHVQDGGEMEQALELYDRVLQLRRSRE